MLTTTSWLLYGYLRWLTRWKHHRDRATALSAQELELRKEYGVTRVEEIEIRDWKEEPPMYSTLVLQ